MAVALQDNALLTTEEACAYLGVSATGQTGDQLTSDLVNDLVNRLSDYAEGPSGANRPLVEQTFTAVRFPGQRGTNLRPRATPISVADPVTLALDGTALTVWKAESDGDPADFDVVVAADTPGTPSHFYRACGWQGCAPMPVLATFTAGFETVPGDLKDAAYLMLGQGFREQTRATSGGGPDIQSYTPGPVTPGVTFRGESLIPMKARQILDAYRIWSV